MSDTSTLLDEYRQHLNVRNFASETAKRYIIFLNHFFTWLKQRNTVNVTEVSSEVIRDYQAHLFEQVNKRGELNSVFHQNNNLKAIKSFFRFLRDNDYIVHDPASDVSYAKTPHRLPRSILTQGEMKKLLHAPNTKTALGYRDRTILEVFYSTGIRREELINLMIEDADFADGFIRVNSGKGKKDRVVPVGKIACRYLENYITAVRPMFVKNIHDNHIFLTLKGGRLSAGRVWDIVKKYSRKAKLKKNISPHTFRHTCATLMLRNKANIRHIQELLGHASLETTQVYTSVSIADLKEVHSKCHPREKDAD